MEDDTDEAALVQLLSKLFKEPVLPQAQYRFRRGGWQMALKTVPAVAWNAYHQGLDGAVFCIDNDEAEPRHCEEHDIRPVPVAGCRLCSLRECFPRNKALVGERHDLAALLFLFAVPVRIIETWLLLMSGRSLHHNLELFGRTPHERRSLKRALYGSETPDRDSMTKQASSILASLDDSTVDAVACRSSSFEYLLKQVRNFTPTLRAH